MYRQIHNVILIIVLLITAGIIILLNQACVQKPPEPLIKITFVSMPASFTAYSIYVALDKKNFEVEGLDVTLKNTYPHGKASLHALVEGETDFAVSSETPLIHSVLNGNNIKVIAVTITAEKHLAVVARKDRGIFKAKDLNNKKIGVTLGSNGEYFLDTVLLMNGLSRDAVKLVDVKPSQILNALINGEVDAIATWNPLKHMAQNKLGDRGSVFYAEGLYSPLFIIAARGDYVDENPDIVKRVVQSLVNTSEFIRNNPDEANNIAARYIKIDNSLTDNLSATYFFNISLSQSFLLTLEHQTEWAIENKLTDQTRVPNYLDFIYTDALMAVKPDNVTLIK